MTDLEVAIEALKRMEKKLSGLSDVPDHGLIEELSLALREVVSEDVAE